MAAVGVSVLGDRSRGLETSIFLAEKLDRELSVALRDSPLPVLARGVK